MPNLVVKFDFSKQTIGVDSPSFLAQGDLFVGESLSSRQFMGPFPLFHRYKELVWNAETEMFDEYIFGVPVISVPISSTITNSFSEEPDGFRGWSTTEIPFFSAALDHVFYVHGEFEMMPIPEDWVSSEVFENLESALFAVSGFSTALYSWQQSVLKSSVDRITLVTESGYDLEVSFSETLTVEDLRDWQRDEFITFELSNDFFMSQDLEIVGSDQDDTLETGSGNDRIEGGEGDDRLEAGEKEKAKIVDDDRDVLLLKGDRSDYKIRDNLETNETTVERKSTGELDTISNFEVFEFENPELGGNSISKKPFVLQMAKWAVNAYDETFNTSDGWEAVHAHQLEMGLTSTEKKWAMANGVFTAEISEFGIPATAVAHVGEALVEGKHTLIVSFRGTDELIDLTSGTLLGLAKTTYWPLFEPLIEGIKKYIKSDANITDVLVTGHSLGGIMAQYFMDEFSNGLGGAKFKAVTIGSPGATFSSDNDKRMLHVEHSEDGVVKLGSLAGFDTAGERLVIPINDKTRPQDDGPYDEHAKELYVKSLEALFEATPELAVFQKEKFNPGKATNAFAGTSGDDVFKGDSGSFREFLYGMEGDDIILGMGGNDTIFGNSGSDLVFGGRGKDFLFGGEGGDTLNGGAGRDTLNGAGGNDLLKAGNGSDMAFGGLEDDTVLGQAGHDTLGGGAGNDMLQGGKGRDVVDGNDGEDSIAGNAGRDTLNGGDGMDTLNGGVGNDLLTGGEGADRFNFLGRVYEGRDVISDFELGIDTLQIKGITFDRLDIGGFNGGADTRIILAGGTKIILEGIAAADITETSFDFI